MDTPPSAEPTPEEEDRALDRPEPHVSIMVARRNGLHYSGPRHVAGIPARPLTGAEVAAYITTRARLLAVLEPDLYVYLPDPDPPSAPAPKRPTRQRTHKPAAPPDPVPVPAPPGAPALPTSDAPILPKEVTDYA